MQKKMENSELNWNGRVYEMNRLSAVGKSQICESVRKKKVNGWNNCSSCVCVWKEGEEAWRVLSLPLPYALYKRVYQ